VAFVAITLFSAANPPKVELLKNIMLANGAGSTRPAGIRSTTPATKGIPHDQDR